MINGVHLASSLYYLVVFFILINECKIIVVYLKMP